MPRLQDRSIIVTGGASGIGRSLCLAFAAEGARVVVGDVRRDQLYVDDGVRTDQAIADAGGLAHFVEADASKAPTSTEWSRPRSNSATAALTSS